MRPLAVAFSFTYFVTMDRGVRNIGCGILVIFALVPILIVLKDPVVRRTILDSDGAIKSGSFIGVQVGENRGTAHTKLLGQGFKLYSVEAKSHCHGRTFSADTMFVYVDKGIHSAAGPLRKGVVCVASSKERVAAVSWNYGWLDP